MTASGSCTYGDKCRYNHVGIKPTISAADTAADAVVAEAKARSKAKAKAKTVAAKAKAKATAAAADQAGGGAATLGLPWYDENVDPYADDWNENEEED